MPYQIRAYGLSDMGLVRETNEDVWAAMPDEHFYVLADGMGGHQAGEVAARQAVDNLCSVMTTILEESQGQHNPADMATMLRLAIIEVNRRVHKIGQKDSLLKGMGTTLCCVHFYSGFAIYAHVGDSRIYRYREGHLEQLTRDHSLYRELVDLGQLTTNQADDFVYRNVITKAIGTGASVEPAVGLEELHAHDLYLMCSDGLSDLLEFEEIQSIVSQHQTVQQGVQVLVEQAKARGGHDNVTVVMMKVEEPPQT